MFATIVWLISLSLYQDVMIANYYGVHKTCFNFTGDYIISTKTKKDGIDSYDVYYATYCESITEFGLCYYKPNHKSHIYEDAVEYAINYCQNTTIINGYIVTEDSRCLKDNPNIKTYTIRIITLVFLCIAVSMTVALVIVCFIERYPYKPIDNDEDEMVKNLV